MTELQHKPVKYYIDFENVHGAGLKGVDVLDERDEVIIIYSQAAETFHIEHAIDIMKSKARIEFVEVDGGTRNAADFQLIVALYADMDDAYDYVIVSGDGGFDAAIRMGERLGKPSVRRLGNIAGDEAEIEKPKSRRSRRSRSSRDAAKDTAPEAAAGAPTDDEDVETHAQAETPESSPVKPKAAKDEELAETQTDDRDAERADEQQAASSRRRSRRKKRSSEKQEEQATAPAEAGAESEQAGRAEQEEAAESGRADRESRTQAAQVEVGAKDEHANEAAGEAAEAHKPRRRRNSKRTSTSKETDDAYARAAEAMRLASGSASATEGSKPEAASGDTADAPDVAPTTTVSDAPGAPASEGPGFSDGAEPTAPKAAESAEKGTFNLVKALLDEKGVQLSDAQLTTIANALDGTNGRQDFYRRIIKVERQQRGRTLYRQVREHYEMLTEALRSRS